MDVTSNIAPFYPFLQFAYDQNGQIIHTYPFQSALQPETNDLCRADIVKTQEVKSKKPKISSKMIVKIKKLLKQLHRQQAFNRKQRWSEEEDFLLKSLVEKEKLQWKQIPKYFENRTQNMCYSRYRRLQIGLKQKRWNKEQEQELIRLIEVHGEKWKKISSYIKNYTSKQIRQHYLNYLRPNTVTSQFSIDEDMKICRYIIEGEQDKHWKELQEILPHRSEVIIKRRFERKLKGIIQTAYDDDQ